MFIYVAPVLQQKQNSRQFWKKVKKLGVAEINRGRLWDKLVRYGINGPFLSTLQSLYEDYQCCVEVNGNCTPWFDVNN